LIEATMHALRHPAYAERYQRTKKRLGKQRGAKVAQVELGRRLARAIWHMLTRVRSQRRHVSSGGMTALFGHAPRANVPISPDPPAEEAIET
jgi:hypothetical protein